MFNFSNYSDNTLKKILISLFLIPLFCYEIEPVYSEEYYYIPDHLLEQPPLFCAMEFKDSQLPEAETKLMEITKDAVSEWENKLVEATGNQEGWDFQFKQISISQQDEPFFDADCTVNIYFQREPPEDLTDFSGYADSYFTFSDIEIFYLEPNYQYNGKTIDVDGELWEVAEITGFNNKLASDVYDTLLHEIGHSLGLDHPKFEKSDFTKEPFGNGVVSPSIMVDPSEYEILGEIQYSITEYDVNSVVNLYGEDGINEVNLFGYLFDFVIIGIFLAIIAFFVRKKFRRKEPELIPIGTSDPDTTRCVRCSRLLSSFSKTPICRSCQIVENN